ncbi:hypothetical protein EVAR_49017_1 [Eumeta japonica]|uniref:Uncharacterized protein n=1 Tax=Eumeta variegata TaxID=151549 RepID=A0A4C1XSQ7_EUMVA|nr:hypothetical protein EVAR_49017_1 [Eumeta japonica]
MSHDHVREVNATEVVFDGTFYEIPNTPWSPGRNVGTVLSIYPHFERIHFVIPCGRTSEVNCATSYENFEQCKRGCSRRVAAPPDELEFCPALGYRNALF